MHDAIHNIYPCTNLKSPIQVSMLACHVDTCRWHRLRQSGRFDRKGYLDGSAKVNSYVTQPPSHKPPPPSPLPSSSPSPCSGHTSKRKKEICVSPAARISFSRANLLPKSMSSNTNWDTPDFCSCCAACVHAVGMRTAGERTATCWFNKPCAQVRVAFVFSPHDNALPYIPTNLYALNALASAPGEYLLPMSETLLV